MEDDQATVLSEFDAQVRRGTSPDGSGAVAERAGPVVRWTTAGGQGWSGIAWSDLDPGTADEVIAEQVRFFGRRGEQFEWKQYSYDRPPDLSQRLIAAGFVPQDTESLMVAEVAELTAGSGVPAEALLPAGVRLVPVTDGAGIELLIEVHDRVFGTDDWLRSSLMAQLNASAEVTGMVVAMAGDEPVSSARIDLQTRTDFAGLWGGGTLPQWRGRGIYRALVAYRARLAAARGYRYLQVDASPQSRPILERLGFGCLAGTTPYVWSPA